MNLCPVVISSQIEAHRPLPFAGFCLVSPDENSFVRLRIHGLVEAYKGYSYQYDYLLHRPDGRGNFLVFNSTTGSLSIIEHAQCFKQSCSDIERARTTSRFIESRLSVFVGAMLLAIDESQYPAMDGLLSDIVLKVLSFIKEFVMAFIHGGQNPPDLENDLLSILNERLPPGIDRHMPLELVKGLASDLRQGGYYVRGSEPFVIFKGSTVPDTYTAMVTNDARISVKNSKGEEMWTNFPKNGDLVVDALERVRDLPEIHRDHDYQQPLFAA